MPFCWDKTAFIELLGVIPVESNESGADYHFRLQRSPITLDLGLNEDMGDCSVVLHCQGHALPLFRAVYLGSPGARIVHDRRGHFIELGAPGSYAGRYDGEQPLRRGLRLRVEPGLCVETFDLG